MSDNMKEAEDAVMNLFPLPSGYPEGDAEGREQKVRADVCKVLERLVEQQSAPAAEQRDPNYNYPSVEERKRRFAHLLRNKFSIQPLVAEHIACDFHAILLDALSAPSPAQEKQVEAAPLCRIAELTRFIRDIAAEKDCVSHDGMRAGSTAIISIKRHANEILQLIRGLPYDVKIAAMERESEKQVEVSVEEKIKEIAVQAMSELPSLSIGDEDEALRVITKAITRALATASPSEDTKRLDWLERRDRACLELRYQPRIGAMEDNRVVIHKNGVGNIAVAPSFRAAIDAAMSSPSVTQTETETSASPATPEENQ